MQQPEQRRGRIAKSLKTDSIRLVDPLTPDRVTSFYLTRDFTTKESKINLTDLLIEMMIIDQHRVLQLTTKLCCELGTLEKKLTTNYRCAF
jgi:hypothetical protein